MWDFSIGRTLGIVIRTWPFVLLRIVVYFGITVAYIVSTGAGAGIGYGVGYGVGLGFGVVSDYPTDNLSQGLFPMPHYPEPESVRSRELSAMQPPTRLPVGNDAVPPASSAGCFPGVSAVRFASISALPFDGWQRTMRTAATGRAREVCRFADPGRTYVPGDLRHDDRLGRDCQSPDRSGDKRLATRSVSSAATAGK